MLGLKVLLDNETTNVEPPNEEEKYLISKQKRLKFFRHEFIKGGNEMFRVFLFPLSWSQNIDPHFPETIYLMGKSEMHAGFLVSHCTTRERFFCCLLHFTHDPFFFFGDFCVDFFPLVYSPSIGLNHRVPIHYYGSSSSSSFSIELEKIFLHTYN